MRGWCYRCIHEADKEPEDGCMILTMSMSFNVDDPEYPKDWVYKNDTPTCLAFQPAPQER